MALLIEQSCCAAYNLMPSCGFATMEHSPPAPNAGSGSLLHWGHDAGLSLSLRDEVAHVVTPSGDLRARP